MSASTPRIFILGGLVGLLCCVGLAARAACEEQDELALEEYAVYAAVIEALYLREGIEEIVINEETSGALEVGPEGLDEDALRRMTEWTPDVEQETLEDFKAKNARSSILRNAFTLRVRVVLVSKQAAQGVLDARKGKSQGLMSLSRVGFNRHKTQALVYVGNVCGPLCGEGYYVLLAKADGIWAIKQQFMAWIS